jgi:diaminopimelate decarboxylase
MTNNNDIPRLNLFPLTSEVRNDHLIIGGCDTTELAEEFGTPLYVFDEAGLRARCAEFKTEFGKLYPDTTVLYASKAFTCKAMVQLVKEEGLGLDVVSGGEMGIAHSVNFPLKTAYFHGNNKSAEELEMALKLGVGRIVVDNFHELKMLGKMAGKQGADILLRLAPGIDPHTHQFNTTGTVDSKFGFTLATWEEAVKTAMTTDNLRLVGLHVHLGSGIFEIEPYRKAVEVVLNFAAKMKQKHGFDLKEFDVGGGFGVQYVVDAVPPPVSAFAEVIISELTGTCNRLKLNRPQLIIEPGRSIVARNGLALYHIGSIKDIPGVRRYVAVDGGMGDNIRHPMYGAIQEALLANKISAALTEKVTICGKFCESGDILIRDIDMPPVSTGDILAVAGCGAYCVPMSSNYNAVCRPAIVFVREGKTRLIRRRETVEDLSRCDLV